MEAPGYVNSTRPHPQRSPSPSPSSTRSSSPSPSPTDTELGISAGRTHHAGIILNNKYYVIPRRPEESIKELLWYQKVGSEYQLILLTPRGRNQIPIISTAPSSQYGGQQLIRDFSSWCIQQNQSAEFHVERNTTSLGRINQLKILNYWFIARDEAQAQRARSWPVQFVQVHFGSNNIPWSRTTGQIFLLSTLKRRYRQFDGILQDFIRDHSIPRPPPPGNLRGPRSSNSSSSRSLTSPDPSIARLTRRLEEAIARIVELENEIDMLARNRFRIR